MITVERRAFAQALDLAGSVIERRNTIPVLGTTKVTANGALRIEASNLDTTAEAVLPYNGKPLDAFALKEPRRVRAAINHSGGENVTLQPESDKRIALTSGELRAALGTLPGEDHPGFEAIAHEMFAVEIGMDVLRQIERVARAICADEIRYYLNGVCVHRIDDWLYRFAATDGHRLMQVDVPLPGATGALPDGMIIPRGFLNHVFARFGKAKEPVALRYGATAQRNAPDKTLADPPIGHRRIAFAGKLGAVELTLASKLIDGTFPDYTRVIPAAPPYALRVSKAALAQAVHALSALASEKVRAVKITAVSGGISLSLTTPDLGEGSYRIAAEHNLPLDHETGFNGQYLLDCLAALSGEEATFGLDDPCAPAVIRDEADTAFLSVLMPMRV